MSYNPTHDTNASVRKNPTQPDYPGHHSACKVLHSTRDWPCFPQSNDSFTLRQKAWIQKVKDILPDSPQLQRQNAIVGHKKTHQEDPEDIEQDDPEPDIKEEEGYNGTQHGLSRLDISNLGSPDTGKRSGNHDNMVPHSKNVTRSVRKR